MRRSMPARRRHADQPQHLRLPRAPPRSGGRRRGRLGLEFGRNHATVLHAQWDWPESFSKIRLAIVYSPITWSRFSICCSSSAIRRSRGSGPVVRYRWPRPPLPPPWIRPAIGTASAHSPRFSGQSPPPAPLSATNSATPLDGPSRPRSTVVPSLRLLVVLGPSAPIYQRSLSPRDSQEP